MRVISGSARGLKLKAPQGLETRPTTDKIKESLFNIIAPDIYDVDFLDIFSGSGAIGIEALSRGAASAVFIDSSMKSVDVIKQNLKAAKLEDRAAVMRVEIGKALASLGSNGKKFDIIFMDPPYLKGLSEKALSLIEYHDLLKPDGFIIAEQSAEEEFCDTGFDIFRTKIYNKTTKMTFLRKYPSEPDDNEAAGSFSEKEGF